MDRIFLLIFSLTLVGLVTCDIPDPAKLADSKGNTANNASNITWASLPEGRAYKAGNESKDRDLEVLYDMVHQFLDVVQPADFPYGKLISHSFSSFTRP